MKVQLDEYVKAQRLSEGVKKFIPKTELLKAEWRTCRTLKYNVPDMIEWVWLHENKSDYNAFIKRYEKDLKFGKVLDTEKIERVKLLLFIFRKVASENPKVATPIDVLECRLQFKSQNPKPYSRGGVPRLSPEDMAI